MGFNLKWLHQQCLILFSRIVSYIYISQYGAGTAGIHKQIQGEGPHNFRFAFFHRDRELDFHSQGRADARPQKY